MPVLCCLERVTLNEVNASGAPDAGWITYGGDSGEIYCNTQDYNLSLQIHSDGTPWRLLRTGAVGHTFGLASLRRTPSTSPRGNPYTAGLWRRIVLEVIYYGSKKKKTRFPWTAYRKGNAFIRYRAHFNPAVNVCGQRGTSFFFLFYRVE